jgi:myosin-1
MEQELYERDRVGLQDQVLLEDYQSEDAFIDNLKKRFKENLIYVSFSLCKFQLKF